MVIAAAVLLTQETVCTVPHFFAHVAHFLLEVFGDRAAQIHKKKPTHIWVPIVSRARFTARYEHCTAYE